MNLEEIKKMVLEIVESKNLILYDIKQIKEYNEDILQILIDKKGGIDIDELAVVNELISAKLDEMEIDLDKYLLEVSSPGAEKELRNDEEIAESIGKYVHVELESAVYEGYLEANDMADLTVKINLKGRMKKVVIKKSEIRFIRLAVKI